MREDFRGDGAERDSSVLVYDDEGRYQALVGYEFSSTGDPVIASRTAATFDNEGQLVVLVDEVVTGIQNGVPTWLTRFRNTYTYREDGLIATETRERGNSSGDVQPYLRFTYTSDRFRTADEAGPDAGGLAVAVAPNPTAGGARLFVRADAAGQARVELFDVLGRRVGVALAGPVGAGETAVELPTDRLAPGLYVVRAEVGGAVASRTLTVTR